MLHRQLVRFQDCWGASGLLRVEREHMKLDSGPLEAVYVSEAALTCHTCTVSVDHALEVRIGLSRGCRGVVQVRMIHVMFMGECGRVY